jgi:GT2 family glycosyltransferase
MEKQDLTTEVENKELGKERLENLITVIISTKNRLEDLKRALISLRSQTLPHKVIVIDDNSDDGTSMHIKSFFPEVSLYTHAESKGYIVRRNEAVNLSQTPYVLSIDDDCVLENINTLDELASFCWRTKSVAVAWPHVDVRASDVVNNLSPANELWQACTFKGCSFVVNKNKFIELGGFRTSFIHQGEEEDFCIRLLDAGLPVLLGSGTPVYHYESPIRSWKRMDYFGSRNLILFAFFNVPLLFLPVQLFLSAAKSIIYGFKIKRPYQKFVGVMHGFRDGFRLIGKERRPVTLKTFFHYRKLKKGHQFLQRTEKSIN